MPGSRDRRDVHRGARRAEREPPSGTASRASESEGAEYLSPNQAGRELGVTGEAVKQWIYQRRLPATKLPNGYWRIARADLERFLRERRGGGPRRLLLVGEFPASVDEVLCAEGWAAVRARNAIDAVLRAADARPSAAVVDLVSLGEMGWLAAEKMHATRGTRRLPVLLVAPAGAEADPRAMERAISVGAHGFLCRPVEGPALARALGELMRR